MRAKQGQPQSEAPARSAAPAPSPVTGEVPPLAAPVAGNPAAGPKQKRKKGGKRSPAGHDFQMQQKGRLPDGSAFSVSYDAAAVLWRGRLTIHVPGGGALEFTGEAPGVFRLLSRLDDQYRAHVQAQQG